MAAIILLGSFSTEFGENGRAFLKFQDYAIVNQIFISWQTENCVARRPTILAVWIFFSDLSLSPAAGKKKKVAVVPGPATRNGKEEGKKTERVGPRAVGLMSLIMEKYIKWHPLYFLGREYLLCRSYSSQFRDILIFMSVPPCVCHFLLTLGSLIKSTFSFSNIVDFRCVYSCKKSSEYFQSTWLINAW